MASFQDPLSELIPQLHPEDQAHVRKLGDVDAISKWVSSRVDDYCRRISALQSIHNALLPIHRLPTEILREVFADPCLDCDDMSLMLVSRYWRAVVLDTPQFWANVLASVSFDDKEDTPLLSACISRSGDLPLRANGAWPMPMWNCLTEAKHRIYDLEIHITDPKDLYEGPAYQDGIQQMTRLVRLNMQGYGVVFESHPAHFTYDANHLPRLRDLYLFQIGFRPSVDVPSLKSLSLDNVDYAPLETMGILKNCPNLEDITITLPYHPEDRQQMHVAAHSGNTHEPVTLPHLKTITIHGAKMVPLLRNISFPASAKLSLDFTIGPESSAVLHAHVPSLFHPSIDRLHVLAEARGPSNCITFCCHAQHRGELRLNAAFDTPSYRWPGPVSVADANAHVFLHSFRTVPITTLSLDLPSLARSLGDDDMASEFFHLVFDSLPHVHTLELLDYTELDDRKPKIAKQFLQDREGREVGGLTLVWDLAPAYVPYREFLSHAEPVGEARSESDHLRVLVDMLRAHASGGKARLRRLEVRLLSLEPSEDGSDGAPDPPPESALGRLDESIIEELGNLVDELAFGIQERVIPL